MEKHFPVKSFNSLPDRLFRIFLIPDMIYGFNQTNPRPIIYLKKIIREKDFYGTHINNKTARFSQRFRFTNGCCWSGLIALSSAVISDRHDIQKPAPKRGQNKNRWLIFLKWFSRRFTSNNCPSNWIKIILFQKQNSGRVIVCAIITSKLRPTWLTWAGSCSRSYQAPLTSIWTRKSSYKK